MDNHTLQVLEFEKIRSILASKASSPLGTIAAAELAPSFDLQEIEDEMDRITELGNALDSGGFSFGPIRDIRDALDRCSLKGAVLSPENIFEVATTLRAGRVAKLYFEENKEDYPLLSSLASGFLSYQEFENAAFRSVSEEGLVLDSASPELASIRRKREKTKETIREKMNSILRSKQDLVQESLVTMRQGRFVIPIKSQAKARLKCVVHDTSASGATLFVEPLTVLELNNELQSSKRREEEEIKKVLSKLSAMLRERVEEGRRCVDVLKHFDLLLAKVRFSSEFHCIRPDINDSGKVDVRGGMHPVLVEKKGIDGVVPLDLRLGPEFNTLLISGPNSGGKTVALKTVGVLVLLCQCGMHVPASAGTNLSIFRKVFADIGDEQSIESDLSTFSSHMRSIVKVMKEADSATLVLLDELGVGTDPRSGTGIGMAVLAELTRRDVRTIATSHYGDMKIFVQAAEGMSNASVEFNPETLRPTYRLRMGIPGSSNTFEIAERLGMDPELLESSRKFAAEGSSMAEEIIGSLEKSLAESDSLAEEAMLESKRLDGLILEFDKKIGKVRAEEKAAKKRRRERVRRELENARALVENLVREIKESQARPEVVRKSKKDLEVQLKKYGESEQSQERAGEPPKPGDFVFVEPFKTAGTVISISKSTVRIEVGKVRCEVPIWSVRKLEPETEDLASATRLPEPSGQFEISLRGMAREEALEALDRHVDRAVMSGLSRVSIVHGKGMWILKNAVEDALRADSRVESFREGVPEEGGWGVTIVKLKA